MTNIIHLPVIAGIEITTDAEGRFNIKSLHDAAINGGVIKDIRPNEWMSLQSTQEMAEVLITENPSFEPIVSRPGRYGGTFVAEQLAVAYANWISPAFYLQVINTFLDSKKSASNIAVPTSLADALQLAADTERKREQAALERDEAIRTKAQIGSNREASAMARASAEARRANKLAEMIGDGKNWKAVKSISWLSEIFSVTRAMYQQVGKRLKAISSEMDIEVKEIEDSAYGTVKAYHKDVISELHNRLLNDGELLAKYRSQARAA